jgi:hypothetical protein
MWRASRLAESLAGAIKEGPNLFEPHEPSHFVELRRNAFDPVAEFDDFDHDGKVLRQLMDYLGTIDARRAVSANATPTP